MKIRTALNIDPLTISQELQLIFGDKVPSNLTIEKWSNYYQKKGTNEKQSSESSTEDIEEVRSLIDNNLHINETETNTSMDSDTNEQIDSEMINDPLSNKFE